MPGGSRGQGIQQAKGIPEAGLEGFLERIRADAYVKWNGWQLVGLQKGQVLPQPFPKVALPAGLSRPKPRIEPAVAVAASMDTSHVDVARETDACGKPASPGERVIETQNVSAREFRPAVSRGNPVEVGEPANLFVTIQSVKESRIRESWLDVMPELADSLYPSLDPGVGC
jgi:hypothetical protein